MITHFMEKGHYLSLESLDTPYSKWFAERIQESIENGLNRTIRHWTVSSDNCIDYEGRRLINFASNDYLGFCRDSRIAGFAAETVKDFGIGAGSSLLVTGEQGAGVALGSVMSQLYPNSYFHWFPSGYQANLGVLGAILSEEATVFSDEYNHASLVDGCKLGRAKKIIYPHLDYQHLERKLATCSSSLKVIITESLFSMQGDLVDLKVLHSLAQKYSSLLFVDEAHSFGVIGSFGKGLFFEAGVQPDIITVTFSKSIGCLGAMIISNRNIHDFLTNQCRALIYTTALPPALVMSIAEAVKISSGAEGERRRAKLRLLEKRIRSMIDPLQMTSGHGTPIVSLSFRGIHRASSISRSLMDDGFLVWGFRPPTVPRGTSLLRISLSAGHREDDITDLASCLAKILKEK